MSLIKTSALNAIAVAVKMLTLLGLNKILALYVGPSGYAVVGQLQNAIQMITTFSSGAVNAGVIRYTAEFHGDEARQRTVWRTAATISFFGAVGASLVIALLSENLAFWFVKDAEYSDVFLWFSGGLSFFVFNSFLLAVINGKKEIPTYVTANIAGSVFSLIIVSVMTVLYGLMGALISLAIYQSLSFFVTLFLCTRLSWFKFGYFVGRVDKDVARSLFKYTLMALSSAICVPVSHMIVRERLGTTLGWESAGYWEAMWRLSTAYLMLITTTLSVYYLPRIAEIKSNIELRREILSGYKVILPAAALCTFLMYVFRNTIINVLFTPEFSPVADLFAFQMVGDLFKIAAWVLAYTLTARAFVGLYIFSEIAYSVFFIVAVFIFTSKYGLEGASIAHALAYLGYFLTMWLVLRLKKIL